MIHTDGKLSATPKWRHPRWVFKEVLTFPCYLYLWDSRDTEATYYLTLIEFPAEYNVNSKPEGVHEIGFTKQSVTAFAKESAVSIPPLAPKG